MKMKKLAKGRDWHLSFAEQDVVPIGIIGCGGISLNQHIPAMYLEVPALDIRALCDTDQDRLGALERTLNVPLVTGDYLDILTDSVIEAVCISTPTGALVDIASHALHHGKHVFVEKPLASSFQEALKLEAVLKGSGLKFQVAFNRRWAYGNRRALELINQGRLGKLHAIQVEFRFASPDDPKYVVEDLLLNVGIHAFDICQFFLGSAQTEEVAAKVVTEGPTGTLAVQLSFANGTFGSLMLSSAGNWVSPGERIMIIGSEGTCIVENSRRVTFLTREGKMELSEPSYSTHWVSDRQLCGFAPQLEHFANCILHDKEPEVGLNDALRALQLSEAVRAQLQEGQGMKGSGNYADPS